MTPIQTFTKTELDAAVTEWGCNCGPACLAVAASVPLDKARRAIPLFDKRLYTSPAMMQTAIETLGRTFLRAPSLTPADLTFDGLTLVQIQLTGPWTNPGASVRAANRRTHWIATWANEGQPFAFDINGGFRPFRSWHDAVLPAVVKAHNRADGGWRPVHVWRMVAV